MKKIVLGCAAVLLSLGLLAGCNNDAPLEEAVIINVDSSATIVVGDTLELAYSVDPAKAEVVAASDNESIVTADAQEGILYLHGVAEGSAVVTLVGTYKKYAEANTNISVKVITEGEVEQEPGPETGGDGGEPEGTTTYKLGFCDDDNYCYRWFDGTSYTTQSGGPFLETTTEWESAADVTIAEAEPEIEIDEDVTAYACTISFTDASETVQYLSWSSSTAIDFSEEEYVWYWVEGEEYSYFCTALDGRYIAAYNDSIRAYAMSNLSNNKPASVYATEPDPIVNPNAGLSLTAVESLTSGGQYYIGAVADAELGTYYLFDGENYNDQQLVGSQVLANATIVTATGSDDEGWTLTCTIDEEEHTLYSYMGGSGSSYCEISTVASSSLETTLEEKSGNATYYWDSTYHGITIEFSSTKYFLAQNRNSSYAYEFQMAGYSSYADSDTWASFYAVE